MNKLHLTKFLKITLKGGHCPLMKKKRVQESTIVFPVNEKINELNNINEQFLIAS